MREPAAFAADLDGARRSASRPSGSTGDRRRRARADRHGGGRQVDVRADPIAAMKAVKNAAEIAGARAAHRARRRGRHELPRLVRSRSAARLAHRDRRRRGAGKLPPRHGAAQGRVVPDHLRRRPERRDRALSRHAPTNRTIAPGELFLVDSGAQYEDGTTDITRTVAVGAPTPEMRDRFTACSRAISPSRARCFPKAPPARSSTPSRAVPVGRRPRFRPRHRPRRRQLSVGARGPGAHLQARHRAAGARHDPVERARLLQGRRLRHPHREPRAGGRGASGRRAARSRSMPSRP